MFSRTLWVLIAIVSIIAVITSYEKSVRVIAQNSPPDVQVTSCSNAPLAIPSTGWLGWAYMDPHNDVLLKDNTPHRGLDFWPTSQNLVDREVRAAHDGVISRRTDTSLRVSAASGVVDTYYSHITPLDSITNSAQVVKGQLLAHVRSNDHLHFVVIKKPSGTTGFRTELDFENSVDPSRYLNAKLNYYDNGNYPAWTPTPGKPDARGSRTSYNLGVEDWCNSASVGSIAGRVRLPSGVEVSNAQVTIEGINQTRITNFWQGAGERHHDPRKQTWLLQTRGGYEFSNVPPGEYLITATKTGLDPGVYSVTGDEATQNYIGYARVQVTANSTTQVSDIILQPDTTSSVTGFVRDSSGAGVADAEVIIRGSFGSMTTRSNSDGQYTFAHVPAGTYKIIAQSTASGEGALDVSVLRYSNVQVPPIVLIPLCQNVDCTGSGQSQGHDIALIIDTSGSMAWNDPNRLRAEAAKLFSATIDGQDRITVIGFSSSGYIIWPLQSVESASDAFNAAIDRYIGVGGGTNISDGLSRAYGQLNDGTDRPKLAILLTDGEQDPPSSYNPYWQSAFQQQGWPVYTFGLSSSAGRARLQAIADTTGGAYAELTDATQLAQFYNSLRVQVFGNTLVADEAFVLQQGESYITYLLIPPFTRLAKFVTTWPGSQVDTVLQSPDGTIIDPNSAGAFVSHTKERTFEVYRLRYPSAGLWAMIAYGQDLSPGGERVTLQADVSITFRQVFLPLVANNATPGGVVAPPEPPISSVPPPTVLSPSGSLEFASANPVTPGSTQVLFLNLSAGEPTTWSGSALLSDCSITSLPTQYTVDAQLSHSATTQVTIPGDAAGKLCTISGTVTTAGTAHQASSIPLSFTFGVSEAASPPPPVPLPIPTPIAAPTGSASFAGNDLIVAGSNRSFELVLTASEATRWNAPAFTSDCSLTGLPSGFATDDRMTHTVSTVVYIPPETGRKTCTINGTVTTHGVQHPQTTLTIAYSFDVLQRELAVVPSPLWSNGSSVEVDGGCIYGARDMNSVGQTLEICTSTPLVPSEWNDQIKVVSAFCGPTAAPVTLRLWSDRDYAGESWAHQFCASAPGETPTSPYYTIVDLTRAANHPIDHLLTPPSGSQTFASIPFALRSGSSGAIATSHQFHNAVSDLVVLETYVHRPKFVHLLMVGGYVDAPFANQQIGELVLYFADGRTQAVPVVAWKNIREGWAYAGSEAANPLIPDQPNQSWQNVLSEPQLRGGQSAYGFIDMLSIALGTEYDDTQLIAIEVSDRSPELIGSESPSIVVMAITVEAQE
jgi:hypothetical protein